MKYSHILNEPNSNYLKLIDSLNSISKSYKNFNQRLVKNFGFKRKLDDKLIEQKKIASDILKIDDKEFQTLFNKINFNFYPKETDNECGLDELKRITEIESTYRDKTNVKENRSKHISTNFVHLMTELLYHDDFIEQLLIEINADQYEIDSEN